MNQQNYILYIDDAENQLSFKALFRRKFPIFTVGGLEEAKELMSKYPFKIVLSNQRHPVQASLDFLQWVKAFDSEIIRIFIYSYSNNPNIETAQNGFQDLTHQCIWKPWNSKEMESLILKWW